MSAQQIFFNDNEYKIEEVQGSVKKFINNFISDYNSKTNETLRLSSKRKLSPKNKFSRYVSQVMSS